MHILHSVPGYESDSCFGKLLDSKNILESTTIVFSLGNEALFPGSFMLSNLDYILTIINNKLEKFSILFDDAKKYFCCPFFLLK